MADPTAANALCSASARGDVTQVESLLRNGADVNMRNKFGRTALQVMKLGSPRIAELLLGANADPDLKDPVGGFTLSHDAAREGFADLLQVLLQHGADLNIADHEGNLPLHLAAKEGHVDVVQLLVLNTAEPSRPNTAGKTACDLATQYRREPAAQYLQHYMQAGE